LNLLGIDLAARFSAGIVLNEQHEVLSEFDSWKYSQLEFVDKCVEEALKYGVSSTIAEDIPYGIKQQAQTKPATRLQGILIRAFSENKILEDLYFLNPSTWQRDMEVFREKPYTPREAAEQRGFSQRLPIEMYVEDIPPLGKEHSKRRSAVRAQLKKASTDYDDAYLITAWGHEQIKKGPLLDVKGVQQYEG